MAYVPAEFSSDSSTACDVTAGVFIHDDSHPRAAIVHIFGEATFADTEALESMIVSVIRIGRPVVLDFSECTYTDCATIGVIIRAAKNLHDQLRLVFPAGSQGYRLLALTGLTRVLHVFESVEEAAAPFEETRRPPRLRAV